MVQTKPIDALTFRNGDYLIRFRQPGPEGFIGGVVSRNLMRAKSIAKEMTNDPNATHVRLYEVEKNNGFIHFTNIPY